MADFGSERLSGYQTDDLDEFGLEYAAHLRLESVAGFSGIRTILTNYRSDFNEATSLAVSNSFPLTSLICVSLLNTTIEPPWV